MNQKQQHTNKDLELNGKPTTQYNNWNIFNNRKFFIMLIIIALSFIILATQIGGQNFIQFFREWSLLIIGAFTIYTGGNIGQKFSRKNKD